MNRLAHTKSIGAALKKLGGIDSHRGIPVFARQRFTAAFDGHRAPTEAPLGPVVLWPDTFTNNFDPEIAHDAVQVLESAGFAVDVPRQTVCCGLTWISTGQLPTAKRVLRRTLRILRSALRAGTPVVVLEPSCAAVFRSDLPELLHGDEDAHRLAGQTFTIGEILRLRAPGWCPPARSDNAMVQQHCHQHAVLSYRHERALLEHAGVDVDVLDAGCCGLAGNFGFERGHYDVSVACAEDKLLPALRRAAADTVVVADGFSCRTQIRELAPARRPVHTVQLLRG